VLQTTTDDDRRQQPSLVWLLFVYYPRESEGICFTGVGLSVCVCLSVTTITKKIVDGFYQILWGGS